MLLESRRSGTPCFFIALTIASLPVSIASSRRSLENQALIFDFARALATMFTQSREGPAVSDLLVMISMLSPLVSLVSSGANFPLIRAPTHRLPTSVCTLYAKSIGVLLAGSASTSPLGVNT